MHLDWHDTPKCQITRQFDDLLQQVTCEVNQGIFELHPMSFHVRLNANDLDEPTYKQVSQSDALELRRWQDAIDVELAALQEKRCFDLVDQAEAEGRQIVDSTWVFKRKRRPDGSLLKYKARLCIRGDKMYEGLKEGEGAKETSGYAPVIDWGTLRILLSLTIQYSLHTTQVDFKNAFVQAPLERPMYMHLPPGL